MAGTKQTPQDLLAAIASGDRGAFGALYDAFAPRLLGLIVKVLGSRDDAEDVLQEVFSEVWQKAGTFNASLGSAEGWLLMRARCRAIDQLRRGASERTRTQALEALGGDDWVEPSAGSGESDDSTRLAREGLAALPDEQRDALCLAYYRGMTSREISDLRGVPVGTTKTRIRLAMLRLRSHFQPQQQGAVS